MKNLPLGIQTFRDFIEENYIYVDKTKLIHSLFARGGKYYLLSRPRRFGKSVLISTLAEIFSGNKELFKGLWIYDKIQWTGYPVIHLDLSKITFKTPEMLEKALDKRIEKIAAEYNIKLDPELFLKEKFGQLIETLAQKQKVVILIDEYDKPMISYMEKGQIKTAKNIRDVFKSFYSVIKASDEFLRFVFITGVSKFSKVSVFSDLNNLRDITLSKQFSELAGYTESELNDYFEPYFAALADETGFGKDELPAEIREWYNGYSWDGEHFVYNPYSIINLFTERSFGNFWFSTGTPTFLVKLIRNRQSEIADFESLPVKSYTFDTYDIDNIEIAALLFQTGYLTIKEITTENKEKTFHLSYPNKEVRDSLLNFLFGEYTQKELNLGSRILDRVKKAISADDVDRFVQEIKSLFASIPYQIFIGNREAYYHSIIYLVLRLTGAVIRGEESTNTGRIDAVLESGQKVYIMEFKMGSAQEAIDQIKTNQYDEKYRGGDKEIVRLGIGFDPDKRNIGDYLLENFS